MKIYIAHNFVARLELREFVGELTKMGHLVTSSWIFDDSHILSKNKQQSAEEDLRDLRDAHCLIIFLNQHKDSVSMGKGKFFEWGFATALHHRIILIGDDLSCVFSALPDQEIYPHKDACLKVLKR